MNETTEAPQDLVAEHDAAEIEQAIERRLERLNRRLDELRTLELERSRLEAALRELRSEPWARGTGAQQSTGKLPRPAQVRDGQPARAARGANQQAILRLIAEEPGATAGRIAAATGIDRAVVYSALSRLAGAGRLHRTQLADGQVAYWPSEEGEGNRSRHVD